MTQTNFSLKTLLLLLLGVLFVWGFSWPIMKLTLQDISPIWLAALRLSIGCLALFLVLLPSKHRFLPTKQDIPFLLSVGLVQMGGFTLLITLGLMHVEAGRSAILAYTTPLWVTPIAVLFFKEHLSKLGLMGIILGIFGVLCLFNPLTFDWSDQNALVGNGLLLLAAFAWAMVIIHIRFGKHHHTPLQLAPWQMLIASIFLVIIAYIFEPNFSVHWSWSLTAKISYLGLMATAFAYWGATELSRQLPATTISLVFLAVPVIGLLSSAVILDEKITINTLVAALLILTGLACVALAKHRAKKSVFYD